MQPTKINTFREILFWPLYIRPQKDNPDDWQKAFDAFLSAESQAWQPVSDLLNREGGDTASRTQYAEFVYFHPFVQRFLYGKPNPQAPQHKDNPAIRLYKRSDINHVAVKLSPEGKTWLFRVDRLHLYLFETQVAMLVVEVSTDIQDAGFKLSDLQNFLDKFRRAYPPYFYEDEQGRVYGGHCPESVVWHAYPDNDPIGYPADYAGETSHRNYVKNNLAPPVARHWQYLLEPMRPYPDPDAPFRYQQIEDERMPFMAYLALENPVALKRGDFIRIGLADDSGDPNTLPYAAGFLAGFEQDYCYDRFWQPAAARGFTTRYLCCGYGFVTIGDANSGFYTNAETGALAHFRHQYFQMGLIAHFHKAALLAMSDRTAEAVANYRDRESSSDAFEELQKAMETILKEFLQFTHRYWFTEVSNQVQAKELFALWTRHLGAQALFEQVKQEIQDANSFLGGLQQAKLGKSAHDLAVFGIPIALVGLLGAWFALNPLQPQLPEQQTRAAAFGLLVSFGFALGLLGWLSRHGDNLLEAWKRQVCSGYLWRIALGLAVFAVVFWYWNPFACIAR